MALDLILGPANAGKVAELYRRYLEHLDGGGPALLVVPDRPAVDRAEHELLAHRGTVVGGAVVTFDAVFDRVVERSGVGRPRLHPARRRLLLGRLVAGAPLEALATSARGVRFADAFARLVDRLGSALVDPARLARTTGDDVAAGELARLYAAWWEELDRLAEWDAPRRRIEAVRLLGRSLDAWDRTALYVQGFEDLSPAQEALLAGVAERAAATLTLPYEPGRAPFALLRATVARLAEHATVTELGPLPNVRPARLARLERVLFEPLPVEPADDETIVALEAGGPRAEAELVLAEVCAALRAGVPPERVAVVTPHDPGSRPEIVAALEAAAVPIRVERSTPAGRSGFVHALERLLRFAWGTEQRRSDLFAFLRSPWSGIARRRVDFVEGRLRGRALAAGAEVYEVVCELLGTSVPAVDRLRDAPDRASALVDVVRGMVTAAAGREGRVPAPDVAADIEVARAVLDAVEGIAGAGQEASGDELAHAVARASLRPQRAVEGRVLVGGARAVRGLDLDVVVVVGLDQDGFGRAAGEDAFVPERQRDALADELREPLAGDLDRHLLYVALTRASRRVALVRRVADDAGRPTEPSPLYRELERAAGGLRTVARRGLGDVTFAIEDAPTARERLRGIVRLATHDQRRARRIAAHVGVERRLDRAERAFTRRPALSDRAVLAGLAARGVFSVTELERFGDCSSWWFVERHLNPREIDASFDAKLQGTIAHAVLQRFFRLVPSTLGTETLRPGDADAAAALVRELLVEQVAEQRLPSDTVPARLAARRLRVDLERFVRQECLTPTPLAATRREVSFGSQNSAPGLKDGLQIGGFAVSGKIDRVDTDPAFSARGLVQDYKTGKRAHSAKQIGDEGRLQIPLYLLAARDLLGIEPLGGLYRALGGGGSMGGVICDEDADLAPPGVSSGDVRPREEMWAIVDAAKERAAEAVRRIHAGDVRLDPRGGTCPVYCPWAGVCRIRG